MMISVIIPTLNEAENIGSLLTYLSTMFPSIELIVSDCGSIDGTAEIAGSHAMVVQSEKGRGIQMNTGADYATGDILWFIHADCKPHPESLKAILKAFENPMVVGGAFEYILDHPGIQFRLSDFFSNWKNRLLHLMFGDMGIFVRASVFRELKGYANIPLMEDVEFTHRLKKSGQVRILPFRIKTSARRWIEEGHMKNWFRNYALQIGYLLGVSPDKLARYYHFH